jgi:hypothetical protein
MAKKSGTFAIALAILLTGLLIVRVPDAVADELSLEAHAEPVQGKNLVIVELTLINKAAWTEDFLTQSAEQRPIITMDVSFNVTLNGKPLEPWHTSDRRLRHIDGHGHVVDVRPGEKWKAVCFVNWGVPLDEAGEYSANVVLSLESFDQGRPNDIAAQSNNFSFAIKPLDREGLNKVNSDALHVVEGKTSWGDDVMIAALSVAFSEEPSAVQSLADILRKRTSVFSSAHIEGKKTCFLPGLLQKALDISLERLGDRNAAVSCAKGMLRDSCADFRQLGVHVILTRGSAAEAEALVKLLDDDDYMVRWEACYALQKLAGFKAVIPENCENQLEETVVQAKKWWSGRRGN